MDAFDHPQASPQDRDQADLGPQPLTVGLAQWNAQATAGGGATAAFNLVITGAAISVVPLIIAFVFLQRYWQSGLSAGSVKG